MKKSIGSVTTVVIRPAEDVTTDLLAIRQAQIDGNSFGGDESISRTVISDLIISGRNPAMIQARLTRFAPGYTQRAEVTGPVSIENAVTQEAVFVNPPQTHVPAEEIIVYPVVDYNYRAEVFTQGPDRFHRPAVFRVLNRPVNTTDDASLFGSQMANQVVRLAEPAVVVPGSIPDPNERFNAIGRTLNGYIEDFRTQEFIPGALENFRQAAVLVNAPVEDFLSYLLPIRYFFGLFPVGALAYMANNIFFTVSGVDMPGDLFIRGFNALLVIFRPFLLAVVNIRVWATYFFIEMRQIFYEQFIYAQIDVGQRGAVPVAVRPVGYWLGLLRNIMQQVENNILAITAGFGTRALPMWAQHIVAGTITTGLLTFVGFTGYTMLLNPQTALAIVRALWGFGGRLRAIFLQGVLILTGAGGTVITGTVITSPAIRSFFERFDEILAVIVEYGGQYI